MLKSAIKRKRARVEAAQRREVLRRLTECEARPDILEPFEEDDLDRMVRAFVRDRARKRRPAQS